MGNKCEVCGRSDFLNVLICRSCGRKVCWRCVREFGVLGSSECIECYRVGKVEKVFRFLKYGKQV